MTAGKISKFWKCHEPLKQGDEHKIKGIVLC